MKNLSKLCLTVLIALLLAGTANALPISGNVSMFGAGISSFDPMSATAIPDPDFAWVTSATGDFDTFLDRGDSVDYYGFNYDLPSSPVANPLWEAGGFTFVLDSVFVADRSAHQLVLNGFGTLSGNGFEATSGSWAMTAVDIGRITFSFANTTSATPVPEPATILLIGTGLLAMAGYGRKKFRNG